MTNRNLLIDYFDILYDTADVHSDAAVNFRRKHENDVDFSNRVEILGEIFTMALLRKQQYEKRLGDLEQELNRLGGMIEHLDYINQRDGRIGPGIIPIFPRRNKPFELSPEDKERVVKAVKDAMAKKVPPSIQDEILNIPPL